MNASQLLAWLICLVLAFFAAALALNNTLKSAMLERQVAEARKVTTYQSEVLTDIRTLLAQIEQDLRSRTEPPTPAATPEPDAGKPEAAAPGTLKPAADTTR